jgi:uncharacterized protein (TIGR02996 family)
MPATDEQAFLAAIAAAPDDDTPRLVFADWLDERADSPRAAATSGGSRGEAGGPNDDRTRAELIRAQCRAATLKPGTKERRDLDRRAEQILAANAERWLVPLRSEFGGRWEFRRGFVGHVEMSAREFAHVAKRLFAAAPTVTSARFPDASNEVNALARCPHLKRLTRIDLRDMCSCGHCSIQDELVALFRSKNAANVRDLNISGNRLAEGHAAEMLRAPRLVRLTHLDLSNNPIGPGGIGALVSTPALNSLESLDLSSTRPTKAGIDALAAWDHPNLKRLALRHNRLGAASVRLLMKSPLANRLRELDLSHNRLGEAGAAALTGQAGFDTIEVLDLRHNDIGSAFAVRKRFGRRVRLEGT